MKNTELTKKRAVGGSANARGIDFQARVSAIVMANALTERQLAWTTGIFEDVPIEILAETGGSGDDIGIKLSNGNLLEVQVKRGLSRGKDLWEALSSLAEGIVNKQINAGILVVCPNSSNSIKNILAEDIIRIGNCRFDGLRQIGTEFLNQLQTNSINPIEVCGLIRIVTISAVDGNRESENTAAERLSNITPSITLAWGKLVEHSRHLIEIRGKASITTLVKVLVNTGIQIKGTTVDTRIQFHLTVNNWLREKLSTLSILGLSKPLAFDDCWIPLKVAISDVEGDEKLELTKALENYHEYASNMRHETLIDSHTLGRYVKRGVILGGPGIGKSSLLKRLAKEYLSDGYLVLLVKLPQVSRLMKSTGLRFEDCLIHAALSGSGIPARLVSLQDTVILADALDECGYDQSDITAELHAFSIAHPSTRLLITSRPIGYQPGSIGGWRHYEIQPLESEDAKTAIGNILRAIPFSSNDVRNQAIEIAQEQIEKGFIKGVAARSPLMLTLIAALVSKGIEPHGNRSSLYSQLFNLIEEHPPSKLSFEIPSEPERNRFLEMLGWIFLVNGNECIEKTLEHCKIIWMQENDLGQIAALKVINSALKYWETLGIIERVRTQSQTAITFVHKTFGEFAAARYIYNSHSSSHKASLIQVINSPNWQETLSFASHLGLANLIIESWTELTNETSSSFDFTLDQAIELVLLSGASFKSDTISAFAEFCWKVLQNNNSRSRFVSGDALCTLSQSHWESVREYVVANLESQDVWVTLVSWACLVISPEKEIPTQRLITLINGSEKVWPNLRGHTGFMISTDGRIVKNSFYFGIAKKYIYRAHSRAIYRCLQ